MENEPTMQRLIAEAENTTAPNCSAVVSIYDGTSTQSPKVQEICTNKHPPPIVSEGNSLTISLSLEDDYSYSFDLKAYYTVIDEECGGKFASTSGEIGKF